MALLQISEPGLSAVPHQRRLAAGIDLGTTHSLVATVRSGQATTLPDEQARDLLPSVVRYATKETIVGWAAREQAVSDPAHTFSSVKRLLGRSLTDVQQRYPQLPYHFTASENGLPLMSTPQGQVNPILVSSEILATLAKRAQDTLGENWMEL